MEPRKQKLLFHIVEAHIRTAQPVGSSLISSKYMKDVSSPTIRNEMQELERAGLITHPHTSSGRVPTELGYRNYIENVKEKSLSEKIINKIDSVSNFSRDPINNVKNLAKAVADISQDAVFVAFSKDDVYYTGLSNLFAKPEFAQQSVIVNISQIIDHLDEVLRSLPPQLDKDVSVLLGSDNPFGTECGCVVSAPAKGSLFGILGPMRMDWEKNIGLISYIKTLLEK